MIPNRRESAMATFFRKPDRRQRFLLPVDMQDWLPESDFVHLVLDAVEQMNLSGFEAEYRTGGAGQAPFAPAMMLAVLIYAYANGHRSSRKVERLCWRDVGFRMIVGDQVPDHSVIARAQPPARRTGGGGVRRGAAAVSGGRFGAPGRGRAGRH